MSDDSEYRLPTNVSPIHYDLTIRTDLETYTFTGVVEIDLAINKETSTIVLNVANLHLGDVSIDILDPDNAPKEEVLIPTTRALDDIVERATFAFPTVFAAGSRVRLRIAFDGKLLGNMIGYYRSAWEDGGNKRYYALTQFQPTAARHAFPCSDEPLLKATFAITLVSRDDTVNLSNMPAHSEGPYDPQSVIETADLQGKWKITKFETTPRMSTYIVAFANGHFEHLESNYTSPLSGTTRSLRIYTTRDVIHQAQFALDVKAKVLPLYEKIFDIEYPLPKLDTLVASDFDLGAMENWGLITGRTSVFLLDPTSADMRAKQSVVGTMSHEVAHMWFGNITTMEWWNYLYLNEGFATMMGEVIISDKLYPEWKVDSRFITDRFNRAMALDAKLSSHPIEVDCPNANHVYQIFDGLSYSKAAAVLRMLSNYVGEERFLEGVSLYLKKRLYGNSVTKDLWSGIGEATGIDTIRLMNNWISSMGFPVLVVTEVAGGIRVRQDRFLETGLAEGKDNETIWTIPLNILSADESGEVTTDRTAILDEREKVFKTDTSKPFKLNSGTTGFYRVLYTPERLAKIAAEAAKDDSVFSLNDRIGLVHDVMALSKAGLAPVSSALTVVNGMRNDKEYLVWDGISSNLSELYSVWWEDSQVVDLFNSFRRKLFAPLVERLGYDYTKEDSADTSLLRTLAIRNAAFARDDGVTSELKSRFAHLLKTGDDSRIPPDLQRVIFLIAVRHGGREEYEAVKQIHQTGKTPTARLSACLAMCGTEDPSLIQETLEYTLARARDQDVSSFFAGLASNFKSRRLLAGFFKDRYDEIYKRFESSFTLNSIVSWTFDLLSTEHDYQDIVAFFKDKDTSKYDLALSQTLDTIHAHIAIIERSSADILEWLERWESASK